MEPYNTIYRCTPFRFPQTEPASSQLETVIRADQDVGEYHLTLLRRRAHSTAPSWAGDQLARDAHGNVYLVDHVNPKRKQAWVRRVARTGETRFVGHASPVTLFTQREVNQAHECAHCVTIVSLSRLHSPGFGTLVRHRINIIQ